MEHTNRSLGSGDAEARGSREIEQPLNNQTKRPPQESAWKKAATGALLALRAKFPQCFVRLGHRSRQPLKVGIHADIAAAAPDLDPANVGKALALYTGHAGYLRECVEDRPRIGLDGKAAGIVSAVEANHAAERLAKIKRRRTEVAPTPRQAATPKKLTIAT